MAKNIPAGQCYICEGTFEKKVMTNHLKRCLAACSSAGDKASRTSDMPAFHLRVEGLYLPEYWLHVETRADAMLLDLDGFLRDIWLECCGHLSQFTIGKIRYASYKGEMDDPDDKLMKIPLAEVLSPRLTFLHEYDFGSTTHLRLKVVETREVGSKAKLVRLLARNNPPIRLCVSCGNNADLALAGGFLAAEEFYCRRCAAKTEHEEEMFLPLVNSPRTGVCGYTGE